MTVTMSDAPVVTAQGGPSADMVRAHLDRMLAGNTFGQSERVKRLLRFLVEQALDGKGDQLKEYSIGIDVFDRTPEFDPRIDSTVRVQTGKLREKIREYYLTEGRSDALRIDLPRGSYTPVFHLLDGSPLPASIDQPLPTAPARALLPSGSRWLPWLITVLTILAAVPLAYFYSRQPAAERRALRFTIPPPENWEFGAVTEVSPDGHRVLANIVDKSGKHALWVRPLDATSGYVLPGTEGASRVVGVWSADGESVIFARDGVVKRLDLAGMKPPETVGQWAGFWGLSCNSEGVVLVGADGGGIHRLYSGIGGGKPVTNLDLSQHELGHYQPRFLPDGEHFLYFALNANSANNAIYVGSLDGRTRKRLVPASSRALYVSPSAGLGHGYLVFARAGALMAQQFDPKALRVSGDPFRIIEHVAERNYGFALFSASRSDVLLYRESGISEQSELVWLDRSGNRLGVVGTPGVYGGVDLSPDDKTLVVDRIDEGPQRDIWTIDVASGEPTRQTFHPDIDHFPIWCPDGRRVIFDSHRNGAPELYVKAVNGPSAEERLVQLPVGSGVLDWSRDGRFIAYHSPNPTTNKPDLWMLPVERDRKPFRFLESARSAQFSPDGRWIAYVSDDSGTEEIYVRSFSGSAATVSDAKWQISLHGGTQARWRRDGRELFYMDPEYRLTAVEIQSGESFATGSRTILFQLEPVYLQGFAVTADARRFLVKTRSQASRPAPIHVFMNWLSAVGR